MVPGCEDYGMHELGLLHGVVTAVNRAAAQAGAIGVRTVAVRVGAASGVVVEALQGAWPFATAGTGLASTELLVEPVPATVWCDQCGTDQPIDEFFALTCPQCGSITPAMPKGREFEVAWIDLQVPD